MSSTENRSDSFAQAIANLPEGIPKDFVVTKSPFPSHDELGRLLCKGCGLPYKTWTLDSLLENYQKAVKQLSEDKHPSGSDESLVQMFNCLNCKKVSLFDTKEIFKYQYRPSTGPSHFSFKIRDEKTLCSKTGHLICLTCGEPFKGFTVKGAVALLNHAGEQILWITCEKCRRVSDFPVAALRRILPEAPPRLFRSGETILTYPILDVLQGGMGVVYMCLAPYGPVAIKFLRPEIARLPEAEERFRRESETWIMLGHHPNVVEAKALTVYQGQSAILMEYQGGGSLASRIALGNLTLGDILQFATDFCCGMLYATSVIPGFVHRDIKPDNCLIGNDGKLKVSDFGLVKIFDELTGSEQFKKGHLEETMRNARFRTQIGRSGMGTLPYMAPEQFQNFSGVDHRSDVYSFGVMLYQMISGHLPIIPRDLMSAEDWEVAHSTIVPANVHQLKEDVPENLAELVSYCLEKEPAKRPNNFDEVLRRLWDMASRWGDKLQELSHKYESVLTRLKEQKSSEDDIDGLDMLRPFNLLSIGRPAEALESAEHIIRIASRSSHPNSNLVEARGHALCCMVFHHLDQEIKSLEEARQALLLDPNEPLALYYIGWYANHNGNFSTAIEALEKSYKLDPNRDRLRFELGFAHNASGTFKRAIEVLKEAIDREPDNYIFHREIGFSFLHTNQLTAASDHYERAFALCPSYLNAERAEISFNLSQVYGAVGKREDANKWFEQAWRLAPKESKIHRQISEVIKKHTPK